MCSPCGPERGALGAGKRCCVASTNLSRVVVLPRPGFAIGVAAGILAKAGVLFSFPPEATT
jgi:hypothetical protein